MEVANRKIILFGDKTRQRPSNLLEKNLKIYSVIKLALGAKV